MGEWNNELLEDFRRIETLSKFLIKKEREDLETDEGLVESGVRIRHDWLRIAILVGWIGKNLKQNRLKLIKKIYFGVKWVSFINIRNE